MANWYTSTRNGNDTTGDGSTVAPFATIYKAATVALPGDTINTEGDELVNANATVTSGGSTFNTSTNLTGVMSPGTIFTINDPVWGIGKVWFKVRSITSNSITCNQNSGVNGTFDLYYIANPSYSTSSNTNPEDLSSLTLDGLNFEGGWDPTFTTQDRITWSTYVTTSTIGGTTFLRLGNSPFSGSQSNLSFNRFGVGGNTLFYTGQSAGGSYTNLYSAYGPIAAAGASTCDNWHMNAATANNYPRTGQPPLHIINLWFASGSTSYFFGDNNLAYKITNLYAKAYSTSLQPPFGGILNGGSVDVGHLYIDWMMDATSNGSFTIGNDAPTAFILRGLTHQGNYVGTGKKITSLRLDGLCDAQVVTTQNVDDWGLQGYDTNYDGTSSFGPIKDIEGNKQFWGSGNVVFADPTVFDTGTNSFRVSKAITADQNQTVPIKGFYNDTATEKTITIRAKATTDTMVQFGIAPNGAYTLEGAPYVVNGIHTITSTWADYTLTLPADKASYLEDSFCRVTILASGDWASNYVWIDSVTIA